MSIVGNTCTFTFVSLPLYLLLNPKRMQEEPSTARIALKYGVIVAVASIVYTVILLLTEKNQNQALSALSLVITLVGMIYAMREFKADNSGYMSYGQGLGIGTLIAAISGLLSSTFMMFYSQFIDTNLMQKALDTARADMERRGMSDAQIDAGMQFSEKMMSPGIMFAVGIFFSIFIGFILALIVAAIMRRNRPVFE